MSPPSLMLWTLRQRRFQRIQDDTDAGGFGHILDEIGIFSGRLQIDGCRHQNNRNSLEYVIVRHDYLHRILITITCRRFIGQIYLQLSTPGLLMSIVSRIKTT